VYGLDGIDDDADAFGQWSRKPMCVSLKRSERCQFDHSFDFFFKQHGSTTMFSGSASPRPELTTM
jgi:hypothetical protein